MSVGQKRKLQLAKITALKSDIILLDEPTNHMDTQSCEEIEDALLQFKGAIIAVSHDRWFINKIATQVWNLHLEGVKIMAPEDIEVLIEGNSKKINFKNK